MDTKKKYSTKTILIGARRAFDYARKQKGFYPLMFLTFSLAVVDPVTSLLWSKFIDAITKQASHVTNLFGYEIPWWGLIIGAYFLIIIIDAILDRMRDMRSFTVNETMRIDYMASLAHHVFRLPLSFHKSFKAGEFKDSSRRSASALSDLISNNFLNIAPGIVSVVVILGILYSINAYLSTVILSGLIVFITINIYFTPRIVVLMQEQKMLYRKAAGYYDDAVTNVRAIKDFAFEDTIYSKLLDYWKHRAFPKFYEMRKAFQISGFLQQLTRIITRAIVLGMSIYLFFHGKLTLGTLLLFSSYLSQVYNPFAELLRSWRQIQDAVGSIQEGEDILKLPQENYSADKHKKVPEGTVEFKNVEFGYEGQAPILTDINFEAKTGQTIAFVGESGVGKSSLIDLIMAYYFPSQGSVLIDGIPSNQVDLHELRRSVAIVPQDITLFNDTIRVNVAYGEPNATDAEIEEAARKAHCLEFIQKFPDGWNQVVGERGIKLSGGQKQRVAIARAMLRKPKILILDEPTSALDASSEKIITGSFEELMKGRTTFIVAHRLSTVRRADCILVFKNGTIVERGTHAELLQNTGGEYRRLHDLQIGLHE